LQTYFRERGLTEKLALGHFGTLDPLAGGVLPLAIGKATKLFPLIGDRTKRYAFTLVLGHSTTSGDEAGELAETLPVPENALEFLRAALPRFHGELDQIPPMASALKHEGKRLYALAREGIVVERPARRITVFALELLGADETIGPEIGYGLRLRVHCSEGTYVRTLCEDLARAIGTCGHMRSLLRESAGPFNLETARTFEEIEADPRAALIDPFSILPYPELPLEGERLRRFRHGQSRAIKQDLLAGLGLGVLGDDAEHLVFVTAREHDERVIVGLAAIKGHELIPRAVFA
jgi:tRNA pseudouridine55 synthase